MTRYFLIPLRGRRTVISTVAVTAVLLLAACSHDKAPTANSKSTADDARLFTVPQDQLAHIQVVTLQPTQMIRTLTCFKTA